MKVTKPMLYVSSLAATKLFYEEKLGWKVKTEILDKNDQLRHLELTFGNVAFMFGQLDHLAAASPIRRAAEKGRGGGVILYINLGDHDIEAYYNKLTKAGVTITEPLEEKSWGEKMFLFADPDGFNFAIAKSVVP